MTVTIQSSRFGAVEIEPKAIIDFPEGLIGLDGSRYTLLVTDVNSPFAWLHSVDDPQLALPVTTPRSFFPDYELLLDEQERERLGLADLADADLYVTVRSAPRLEDFAANLRAPILIHGGRGHQVLNQAPHCPLRAALFTQPPQAVAGATPAPATAGC